MTKLIHSNLTYSILQAAFRVHNALGPGLLESAYEDAFCRELTHQDIQHDRQHVFPVLYRNDYVSSFIADLVVADTVILEFKSVKELTSGMVSQLINYLKLSRLPVGLLINFGGCRVQWKRFINTPPGCS